MSSPVVTNIELTSLPLVAVGKVRNLYEINESTLLMVTSDRISAYDVRESLMTLQLSLQGA